MALTILHAEDHPTVAAAAGLALEAEGRQVVTCADGKAAPNELASPSRHDLLIADSDLPRLGGKELISCVHMFRRRARPCVVTLAAAGCERDARRAGVAALQRKPEGVGELVPTIKRLPDRGA